MSCRIISRPILDSLDSSSGFFPFLSIRNYICTLGYTTLHYSTSGTINSYQDKISGTLPLWGAPKKRAGITPAGLPEAPKALPFRARSLLSFNATAMPAAHDLTTPSTARYNQLLAMPCPP